MTTLLKQDTVIFNIFYPILGEQNIEIFLIIPSALQPIWSKVLRPLELLEILNILKREY